MKNFFQLREETSGQSIRVSREIYESAVELAENPIDWALIEAAFELIEEADLDDELEEKYTDKQKAMKTAYQVVHKSPMGSLQPNKKNLDKMPDDSTMRKHGHGRAVAARNLANKPGVGSTYNKAVKDAEGSQRKAAMGSSADFARRAMHRKISAR